MMTCGSIIIPGVTAPAESTEEALLVVDVCDSTGLAQRRGEDAVCRCVTLLGQILDTNTSYLAKEMGKAGVTVRFRTAVGDYLEEIEQVLRCAAGRCDMVVRRSFHRAFLIHRENASAPV